MSSLQAQKPKFSVALQTDVYQRLINNTLQDPNRAKRFIASISSAVAANPALQNCDAGTILSCGLLGESLNLSPSPQLGQYYLVPFEQKAKTDKNGDIITPARTVATFILGYKGYIQLAIRSGQYKKLNVMAIKKGELVRYDPLAEELEVKLIQDELERETAETVGYYAMFEYVNGFRKTLYWSREKMEQHALRYSPAFGPAPAKGKFPGRVSYADYKAGKVKKDDEWAYSSFWYKDFDGMAFKTMLRQIISKWGIMSIEMQQAFEGDNAVINSDLSAEYVTSNDIGQAVSNDQLCRDGSDGAESEIEEAEPGHSGESDLTLDDLDG